MLLICIGLAACNDDNSARENNNQNLIKVKNSEISDGNENKNASNTEMAKQIAHLAASIPGVQDATAIVLGPYSIVGIDVDKDLDRTRVGSIKYSVAEAIKQEMNGNNTMVVADGDVTERLRRMSYKLQQGHPEDAILDELGALIGRYMPEVPPKQNQPSEPDTNKQMLDKQKEQQLENTKDDQSNNNL